MRLSESQLLQFIEQSSTKVSFPCLQRYFSGDRLHKKELKSIVDRLIQAGKLCYTSHFGTTFIEISYDQPRVVSKHVILKPPRTSFAVSAGQVDVVLQRGASFGVGEHPTTRLAIQLIDATLHAPPWNKNKAMRKAIDIGTGSGVLAIVAAKMGVGFVRAFDTDPCAVYEARQNVRLNFLESSVRVRDGHLDSCDDCYDIVLANLRTPTLFSLRDTIDQKIASDGVLVLSGIKTEEIASVGDFYEQVGYSCLKKIAEKGWSAITLGKGPILRRED